MHTKSPAAGPHPKWALMVPGAASWVPLTFLYPELAQNPAGTMWAPGARPHGVQGTVWLDIDGGAEDTGEPGKH